MKALMAALLSFIPMEMQKWMKITADELAARFKDPVIRGALREMWFPEFSMFFMLFTFAYLHNKNAGYPIGGSLPMSLALAKRYTKLGGAIHYDNRVEKILVDGSEHRAGRVISAADGYATIFKMLDGKYADEKTREPYEKWPAFPSLLFVGLGVNRSFADEPKTVSGMSFALRQPTEIADAVQERLPVHIFNQDPTLAPTGKTSLVVMLPSSYEYWKELLQDRAAYDEKKGQVARTMVELLEQRFPGISGQVEMVDVATPISFEHYTGNWKGSFEGWLITPQNSHTMLRPMRQTLPGLQNFYMCGQWVQLGGGLPSGVMTGRQLLTAICKEDGKKFQTTVV
jgi:phytoene dehydrogenase-like protein